MSNETKWTPGPWVADIRSGCCAVYQAYREEDGPGLSKDDERNIFFSSRGSEYNGSHWVMCPETQANARLIAAAPELYEALDRLVAHVECGGAINADIEVALDAMAKARGEQ